MQNVPSSQICWSTFTNRDPTPSSAFHPPLQLTRPSTPIDLDLSTTQESEDNSPALLRPGKTRTQRLRDRRNTIDSLRAFVTREIGISAIQFDNPADRRCSSVYSQHSSIAPPVPYHFTHFAKAVARYDEPSQGSKELAFFRHEILEVSLVSRNWWFARKASGETGFAPSNFLELLSDRDGYGEPSYEPKRPSTVTPEPSYPTLRYSGERPTTMERTKSFVRLVKRRSVRLYRRLSSRNQNGRRPSVIQPWDET